MAVVTLLSGGVVTLVKLIEDVPEYTRIMALAFSLMMGRMLPRDTIKTIQ